MSKSEAELRRDAELRMWQDRMEALKQAGLMPELTEPVISLIQEKVASLEQEKVAAASESLPEPSIQVNSASEQSPPEPTKINMAQAAQREEPPAPAPNPMLDFFAELSSQFKTPELPVAASQAEPTAIKVPNEPAGSIEPIPEAKAAIPVAAALGIEPLLPNAPTEPQAGIPVVAKANDSPAEDPPSYSPQVSQPDPGLTAPAISISPWQVTEPPETEAKQPAPANANSITTEPIEIASIDPLTDPLAMSTPNAHPQPTAAIEIPRMSTQVSPESPPQEIVAPVSDRQQESAASVRVEPVQHQPEAARMSQRSKLEDRKAQSEQQKPSIPREVMPQEMLERYKQIQASQGFRDDSRHRIGGGFFPNATPGGSQASVRSQQDSLGSAAEEANSQLGMLLERLAREHASLVVHIREANRILDESQY